MKNKERDGFDDLFRSRLHDFEMDTMPGDWEAIADRLPKKNSVPFRKTIGYWAAAAVASLLIITSGVYVFNDRQQGQSVADKIEKETKKIEENISEDKKAIAEVPEVPAAKDENTRKTMKVAVVRSSSKPHARQVVKSAFAEEVPAVSALSVEATRIDEKVDEKESETVSFVPAEEAEKQRSVTTVDKEAQSASLIADAAPVAKKQKSGASRKWGFGMGGGGLSVGADNSVPQYMMKSALLTGDKLMSMNSPFFNNEMPKTDVHHKTPVSVGLSVSRYLNNRFSLQTGLSYSFLSSEWSTNGPYHGEVKQKLHFIGIPLSLSYKIAEWNRFQVYAAAGAMAEVNVAGKQKSKVFFDDVEISAASERVRMKEWLWSVNARAGVSYPLIRFVSAFAEVGAGYYFDNGSNIETIHSEKPFNVSFQLGFRLGF